MATLPKTLQADNDVMKNHQEATQKSIYYENIINAEDELLESLKQQIAERRKKTVYYLLSFIPVIKVEELSRLDIARLEIEKEDVEQKLFYNKKQFEFWKERVIDNVERFTEITKECNANFDDYIREGKQTGGAELRSNIDKYMQKNFDGSNQQLKNEFYLYLKQKLGRA